MKYVPINYRANLLLDGIVGKDPELNTYGETQIATFSVAHSKSVKKNGEYIETTNWYNCKAFNYMAEKVMKQIKKGINISIIGELQIESFTNSQGIDKLSPTITIGSFLPFNRIALENANDETEDKDIPF